MFDQSVTVVRIWGVPVRLHVSLLLFLPYVAFVATYQFTAFSVQLGIPRDAMGLPPFVWGILLAVGLFVSILLHELAHSAVALRGGGKIHSITLMMLGGVTRMKEEVPPEREAWMAFAGPLASLAIALVSYLGFRVLPLPPGPLVALLVFAWTNLVIGVFNLLPAFPMDGGRVLRGLLVRRVGRERATRVATDVGRWMAVALGILGLLSFNVLLMLIAVFIYMGASAERARLEVHDVLHGMAVIEFMTDRLGEVHVGEHAGEVARRLLQGNLDGATVVEDPPGDTTHAHHRTVGVVTAWELADRAVDGGWDAPIQAAMHSDWPTVHPEDDAAKTLDVLATGAAPAIVVVNDENEVIGLVTEAELRRAVALAAMRRRHPIAP